MIEVENDQAITLIKQSYTKYIDAITQTKIKQYDTYTNGLLACIIAAIVCGVIYGYTQIVIFIVFVLGLLVAGLFCSRKRTILIKDIVHAINTKIAKEK